MLSKQLSYQPYRVSYTCPPSNKELKNYEYSIRRSYVKFLCEKLGVWSEDDLAKALNVKNVEVFNILCGLNLCSAKTTKPKSIDRTKTQTKLERFETRHLHNCDRIISIDLRQALEEAKKLERKTDNSVCSIIGRMISEEANRSAVTELVFETEQEEEDMKGDLWPYDQFPKMTSEQFWQMPEKSGTEYALRVCNYFHISLNDFARVQARHPEKTDEAIGKRLGYQIGKYDLKEEWKKENGGLNKRRSTDIERDQYKIAYGAISGNGEPPQIAKHTATKKEPVPVASVPGLSTEPVVTPEVSPVVPEVPSTTPELSPIASQLNHIWFDDSTTQAERLEILLVLMKTYPGKLHCDIRIQF